MLPNPMYTSLTRWAAEACLALESRGIVPRLVSEDVWQDWGAALGLLSAPTGKSYPNPYFYPEWRQWALDFMAVLEGADTQ